MEPTREGVDPLGLGDFVRLLLVPLSRFLSTTAGTTSSSSASVSHRDLPPVGWTFDGDDEVGMGTGREGATTMELCRGDGAVGLLVESVSSMPASSPIEGWAGEEGAGFVACGIRATTSCNGDVGGVVAHRDVDVSLPLAPGVSWIEGRGAR